METLYKYCYSARSWKIMKRLCASLARLLFFSVIVSISVSQGIVTPGQVIRDGETLPSAGGKFELGFFSPGSERTGFRYLGIWYKNITPQLVVWVANRENSLLDSSGAVNLTSQGFLVLVNSSNSLHWSSNTSRSTVRDPVVQLLDSGNLVVREKNDEHQEDYLWQSFDYPCDALLPRMRIRKDLRTGFESYLSTWQSADDPAPGQVSFHIDARGWPQLVIKKGLVIKSRPGSWNGITWSGCPFLLTYPYHMLEFELNNREVYYYYRVQDSSARVRSQLDSAGVMTRYSWNNQTDDWQIMYTTATDICENYGWCGAYSSCTSSASPVCSCLYGFVPKVPSEWNSRNWADGCVRRTSLDCDPGNRFLRLSKVKLPDTSSSTWSNSSKSLQECEGLCLNNCNCTGYTYLDISRDTGCLFWHDEIIDLKTLTDGGQDLFVRLAASELDEIDQKKPFHKQKRAGIIAGCILFVIGVIVAVVWTILFIRRKSIRKAALAQIFGDLKDETQTPIFDLTVITDATNNFSNGNKLGEGGFGFVYKGTLADGQEIAVKRLSKSSGQGLNEFKTEVMLISKLQHRNLVRVLGCCIHGDEKMLIYEFMAKRSLDSYIFDTTRRQLLDWTKRSIIIRGIARGLLYLHQDSRLRIIHRDLKASNILLDSNMNPKISDFGLARTFGADQSQENTKKVVGTYGYMAPEYAVDGFFSMKSDVFSFGVLVLEILSGKRNRGFHHTEHDLNLLGHAWMLWMKGTPMQLIDKSFADSCDPDEVTRCIHLALLCVQQRPEDRPTMATVVMMFSAENWLPDPKQPGYFLARNLCNADSSGSCSENFATITVLGGR